MTPPASRKSSVFSQRRELSSSLLDRPLEAEELELQVEQMRESGDYASAARAQSRLEDIKKKEERHALKVWQRAAPLRAAPPTGPPLAPTGLSTGLEGQQQHVHHSHSH
jgi:hypothetical protein